MQLCIHYIYSSIWSIQQVLKRYHIWSKTFFTWYFLGIMGWKPKLTHYEKTSFANFLPTICFLLIFCCLQEHRYFLFFCLLQERFLFFKTSLLSFLNLAKFSTIFAATNECQWLHFRCMGFFWTYFIKFII